jgi:hypothetical protein
MVSLRYFSVFIAIRSFTAKFASEAVTASQVAKQGRQHSNLNDVDIDDSLKGFRTARFRCRSL